MLFNKKLLFLFFIFFTSKTYAEKSLNFYDYEFLIQKN